MSSAAYYLLWLAAGLVLTAVASALITLQLRKREVRRLKCDELLDALARYSEWVAAQGRGVFFQADTQGTTVAVLQELGAVQQQWFPELYREAEEVFAVHRRLIAFLLKQQTLRLRDPEGWLESDQDAGYMALWQQHCRAVQAMEQGLGRVGSVPGATAQWTSTA
jgi:hypothetical protein